MFGEITRAVIYFLKQNSICVYNETTHKGLVRHLFLRCSAGAEQIALCLVINGRGLPKQREFSAFMTAAFPQIKSIVLNFNSEKTNVILGKEYRCIFGTETIEDTLLGKRFQIAAASFYQVNRDMCEKLYAKVGEYAALQAGETLIDLYCGAGTIGICTAKRDTRLIGVEIVPEAVENAETNAALNQMDNAEFLCADAEEATSLLKERGITADCVIIDPPRKGCDEKTIENILSFEAKRLVYVTPPPWQEI